jgi:hypothetical protein
MGRLGERWDDWVGRLNAPEPKPERRREVIETLDRREEEPDDEPLTLRDVVVTVALFAGGGGALLLLHTVVDFNWSWIPWKQLIVVGLILLAIARWVFRSIRTIVRRARGLPPPEREPTRRDRIAEQLRDLDEPYLRHERSLTRD